MTLGLVIFDCDGGLTEHLTALGAEVFHDMREVPERVAQNSDG